MDISVIIPTFNRSASLDALLDDLRNQSTSAAFEILVVDNGSVDATREVVARHAACDARIRSLHERRRGASNARNAGVSMATAPILAFLDDDVRPRHDWVESVARAFFEHPEVDCIGGRVEPRWPCPPPPWLTSAHWPPLALQIVRGTSTYIDREHATACLITANFACRAAVFRDVGGFAREFRRDEDREFNLRMWRSGKRGMFVNSVVVAAEIQPERLAKRYHRAWYHVTGASHARLYYLDTIDHDGRLDTPLAAKRRVWFGLPAFLYRQFGAHVATWLKNVLTGDWSAVFFEECRIRYLSSYFTTRWREPRAPGRNHTVRVRVGTGSYTD
ncbi:MAG TPA: glycosyltransferase [Gemmatimonadaceae bacterium]|nr:glycosyltransferase [Gemmatimonadaceae bacterium]